MQLEAIARKMEKGDPGKYRTLKDLGSTQMWKSNPTLRKPVSVKCNHFYEGWIEETNATSPVGVNATAIDSLNRLDASMLLYCHVEAAKGQS